MDEWSLDRLRKAGHFGRGNSASKGMRWEGAWRYREWVVVWHGLHCITQPSHSNTLGLSSSWSKPASLSNINLNWLSVPQQIRSNSTSVFPSYFSESIFYFSQRTIFDAPYTPHTPLIFHPSGLLISSAFIFVNMLSTLRASTLTTLKMVGPSTAGDKWNLFRHFWRAVYQSLELVIFLT